MTLIEEILDLENKLARAIAANKVRCIEYFTRTLAQARAAADQGGTW